MKTKYFYHKMSSKLKNKNYMFKFINLSYNRYDNGNAEIFIHFFNHNLIIYLNGLKQYKQKYISFIKY
jgi:hypothetical protein